MSGREVQHIVTTLLADSNELNGAINKSALGSSFTIQFQSPFKIPDNATNLTIIVKNAVVWFTTPNIIENVNNKIPINYQNVDYTIFLPTGLYDINTLNTQIEIELANLTPSPPPVTNLVKLIASYSENKILIKLNYPETIVDFTQSFTIRDLIGYDSTSILNSGNSNPYVPIYFKSDNGFAKFNNIDYYLIRCPTLLNRGLEINGNYVGILVKIDAKAEVNSKIVYDPRQTVTIPAPELKGIDLSKMTFELCDQTGTLVDTRGENFSVLFEIHYDIAIPFKDGTHQTNKHAYNVQNKINRF